MLQLFQTSCTPPTTASSVALTFSMRVTEAPTCWVDSPISLRISPAAAPLRCAGLRTSAATTTSEAAPAGAGAYHLDGRVEREDVSLEERPSITPMISPDAR